MNPNAQPGAPESGPSHMPSGSLQDYDQPVAYDQQGRPLYARPPGEHQQMYLSRPYDPPKQAISDEVMRRAAESRKKYPNLNLSDGEYIITAIKRHPIGIFKIWSMVVVLVAVFVAAFALLFNDSQAATMVGTLGDVDQFRGAASVIMAILCILIVGGGMVATYVYNNNRFYLTNESVIQEIQTSLFSKNEQTASLGSIEDASFRQTGIISTMLGYGTIRLSTPGDETTYTFNYVTNPKQHIAVLNNAVEAFKNGRRVEG